MYDDGISGVKPPSTLNLVEPGLVGGLENVEPNLSNVNKSGSVPGNPVEFSVGCALFAEGWMLFVGCPLFAGSGLAFFIIALSSTIASARLVCTIV